MRILVTGAGGFIGGHIGRHLAACGHDVVAQFRRPPVCGTQYGAQVVVADLAEPSQLPRVDAIVHAAATSPAPGVTLDGMVRDNVEGTRRLFRWAGETGVGRIVYCSSLSVYGDIHVPEVDEETPVVSPDAYGASKRLGEMLLREMSESTGLSGLSLRLPGVIGAGAKRNWLAGVLARLRENREIAVFNADHPFNNLAHVDDLAAMIAALIENGWAGCDEVVVGAREPMRVLDAVRHLKAAVGSDSAITERPAPKASFLLSSRRAVARYHYRPGTVGESLDRFAVASCFPLS